jgi:KipI family sensor histidine kinase inhibitor
VEVAVRYDGEDLPDVAARLGLEVAEVIARHAAPTYTVACLGFSRGFPYLEGLDPALRLPRRDSPRPRVPAGAVAIAADQAGIYPQAMPGGWHVLGRTDAVLFDEAVQPPALLAPGDRVRFVPLGPPPGPA